MDSDTGRRFEGKILGYSNAPGLDALLAVGAPPEPPGFLAAWGQWRASAMRIAPAPVIRDTGIDLGPWRVFDLHYDSTDQVRVGGWFLRPASGPCRRGFVVGHGYGGRLGPDADFPFADAAILYFCARGISRSAGFRFPEDPLLHVLQGIESPDRYILRGCVEDLWLGVGAMLRLVPEVSGRLGYLGTSFGGGLGALALAFEDRVQRAHLSLPTFGHHPLRMTAPSTGSAQAVQRFARTHPGVAESTLAWFDAAVAARHVVIPVHCACATTDPAVTPAGQFAVFNSLAGPKELFVLERGHMDSPGRNRQDRDLGESVKSFFENS